MKKYPMTNIQYPISNKKQTTSHLPFDIWHLKFDIPCLNRAGFTLIELLIVIVIIGILSTLVIANFVGVRSRARDAQRKTDLSQIRTALQLYYSDEAKYPAWNSTSSPSCNEEFTGSTGVVYIKKMPCDPNTLEKYVYAPTPAGCEVSDSCTGYTLITCLENTSDADSDAKQGGTSSSTCQNGTTSYTVTNP